MGKKKIVILCLGVLLLAFGAGVLLSQCGKKKEKIEKKVEETTLSQAESYINEYNNDMDYIKSAFQMKQNELKEKYPKITEKNREQYLEEFRDLVKDLKQNKKIKNYEFSSHSIIITFEEGYSYVFLPVEHAN